MAGKALYSLPSPSTPSPVSRLIVVLFCLSLLSIVSSSLPTPSSLYCRVFFIFLPLAWPLIVIVTVDILCPSPIAAIIFLHPFQCNV